MRLLRAATAAAFLLSTSGCAAPDLPLRTFGRLLAESPQDQPARLWFADGELIGVAVATGPGSLPQPVRTTLDAIAPGGQTVFVGREWGPRGDGHRIEKLYDDLPGQPAGERPHFRSVLLDPAGTVLERTHSVPIPRVPRRVLDAGMTAGLDIERVEIVSGPAQEEGWRITTRTRSGWTFVVETSLIGEVRASSRACIATVMAH
ncbi:MAG: hypothetical protein IPK26_22680 [Planctomycetes bacterium]|nr:hypothetical protein [Planctomycetota bacterium]